MHPTADTQDFKFLHLAGRRVMPGVRLLGFFKTKTEARAWQRRAASHDPAPISLLLGPRFGLSSAGVAGGSGFVFHGSRQGRVVSTAHPNKPMHPTADTTAFIVSRGAARRVIGGVRRFRY
jgi:hypothetical protein